MAGCCYGRPTNVAWAITFTDPAANFNVGTPLNVALHPTQLYESAAGLFILIALLLLEKRPGHFAGRTFWSFAFLYTVQ
jgi:phosphatidylglycerol:prolipoprotein diacylglycerol transferase